MGGRELGTQGSFICMMSEYELGTFVTMFSRTLSTTLCVNSLLKPVCNELCLMVWGFSRNTPGARLCLLYR